MFIKNVGAADRLIRLVFGVGLLALALYGPASIPWSWVGWIGVVPVMTALFGTCPAYSLLGISSVSAQK